MSDNLDLKQPASADQNHILVPGAPLFVDLAYLFRGPDCYFSIISQSAGAGLGAEEVVRTIAAEENIDPRQGNWFELKIPAGCPDLGPARYTFNRLLMVFEGWDGPAYRAETLEWRGPDGQLFDAMIFPARPLFHVAGRESLPCPRWLRFLFYRFIFMN